MTNATNAINRALITLAGCPFTPLAYRIIRGLFTGSLEG